MNERTLSLHDRSGDRVSFEIPQCIRFVAERVSEFENWVDFTMRKQTRG